METIIQTILNSSVLIIPMFIWGCIALCFVIEKWISLNQATKQLDKIRSFVKTIESTTKADSKKFTISTKNTYIITFIDILNNHLNLTESLLDKRLSNSINLIESECDKHMSTIHIMGSLFPMIGLLGTVMGMIHIFESLAIHGAGNMAVVSGGISEALITTEVGLISALPLLFIHNHLCNKKDQIITNLDYLKNKVINLKTVQLAHETKK